MTSLDLLTDDTHGAGMLGKTLSRRSFMKGLAGVGAAALAVGAIAPALANHTTLTYTVSANANFRSGPGTGYSILGVIVKGATFKINGQTQNGYAGVIYQDKTGWVLASLVVEAGAPQADPVIVDSAWVSASVNLRSGPGTSYTVLRVVPYGSQIGISDTVKNGFRYVSYAGQAGWMSDTYISRYNPGAGNYGTATANVNLRAEPSTSAAIILVIPKNSPVELLHTQVGSFLNVNFNGKQGWVHKDYISIV